MIQTTPRSITQAEELDHYIFLLQDLVWKILQDAEEDSSLKKRFGQLFSQAYPEGLQLPRAYLSLISHLLQLEPLKIEPQQLPNGAALLDTLGGCPSQEIPEPISLAQLGVIWMILGVRLKNEALQRAGLKIAGWQVHLLDREGRPHLSCWCRARSFRPSTLSLWNYVLFTLAYRLSGQPGFLKLVDVAQQQAWDAAAFPILLLVLVPSKMQPMVPHSYYPFAEEVTVGMLKFTNGEASLMVHLSGWNSGLFSFHKKEVTIVNAGPHVGASDDLGRFGITRTWGAKYRAFQEIYWEKTAYHCHLKGWTQLTALPLWLHLNAQLQAGHVTIEADLQEQPEIASVQEPVNMQLFLRCDRVVLGGKHTLEARTLEQYEGRALTIELQGATEKMLIQPEHSLCMSVIPLAGGEHFWGAHFLVSFPLQMGFKAEVK